jgi:3-dehydroquinate synthase
MHTVTVDLGERSYAIHIGAGILDRLPAVLSQAHMGGPLALVTDSNVGPLYGERVRGLLSGYDVRICTLPAGEERKRLDQIEWLCGRFLEGGLDRGSAVVALGGGVVGDVAGFAAATFMRGIRFAQIPTTVVAQVDSSVGGKTGVNHPLGKNTIGAFHQPSVVLIDMTLLDTLPRRELCSGLAEIVKHGMIADSALFDYMEEKAGAIARGGLADLEWPVVRSCEIKAGIVAQDEREQNLRAILNYGHTFGHAIESATRYTRFLHGEAVALGMMCAAQLAVDTGLLDPESARRQRDCVAACGLPVTWIEGFQSPAAVDEAAALMKHDKKARSGALRLVLPDRIGHAVQRADISREQVRKAFEALRQTAARTRAT